MSKSDKLLIAGDKFSCPNRDFRKYLNAWARSPLIERKLRRAGLHFKVRSSAAAASGEANTLGNHSFGRGECPIPNRRPNTPRERIRSAPLPMRTSIQHNRGTAIEPRTRCAWSSRRLSTRTTHVSTGDIPDIPATRHTRHCAALVAGIRAGPRHFWPSVSTL